MEQYMVFDEDKNQINKGTLTIISAFSALVFFFVLLAGYGYGQDNVAGAQRYRVFNFRYISAKEAINFLNQANLPVDYQIIQPNIMSITAEQNRLTKASEVLRIVDSSKPFEVKTIPSSFDSSIGNLKKAATKLGNIQLGNLSSPPAGLYDKAIIDSSDNACLIIAPAEKMELIASLIKESTPVNSQQTQTSTETTIEDTKTSETTSTVAEPAKPASRQKAEPNFLDATSLLESRIQENKLKASETTDANTKPIIDVLGKIADSLDTTPITPNKTDLEQLQKLLSEANKTVTAEPVAKESAKVELQVPPVIPKTSAKPAVSPKISESVSPPPGVDPNQLISVVLPERIPIITLINLISEYYKLTYIYDPAKIQGDITVRLPTGKGVEGKLTIGELYALLESTLKLKDLVMTRRDNFVFIVPKGEAGSVDPEIISAQQPISRGPGNIVISKVFHISYIDAESIKNLLTGMGLGLEINTQAASAGYIIVTEYSYRMSRVDELIGMVDKPGPRKTIRFRQLKYTMASAMKDKIKTLSDQLGTVSITIARPAASAPTAPPAGRGIPIPTGPARLPQPSPAAASVSPATEAQSVYIDIDDRTNSLLMIGRSEPLAIVDSLIDTLDVAQKDLRSLRLYEIQYADCQDVVTKLEQIGIISAGKARTTTPTRGGGATTRYPQTQRITGPTGPTGGTPPTGLAPQQVTYEDTGEIIREEPQIIVIENTNSLLVNATAEQHTQITTIIAYIDNEPKQASTNYVVYPLESQDPEELAKVLNQLIQETVEQKDASGKIVGTSVTRKTEEDITIIPDKNTFSIICYASKKNQQWVEAVIKQLDRRRPQVLIDVTLVEISKNNDFTLALDLVTKFPSIPIVGNLDKISMIDVNQTSGRRVWGARSTAGAGGTAFYSDASIQGLLTAVSTKGYGRVLAKPKLLVNDNEPGMIMTSEVQTIVSPSTTITPLGVSNQTTNVSVVNTQYTAKIQLDITPHISEGELLRLEVQMNRTDFRPKPDFAIDTPSGPLTGPTPPDLLTSDVKTVITVPDNSTIILGGLERLNQQKGGSKVPILGDLPFIGALFRNTANTDAQSRLYVFVKANILRPERQIGTESDIVRISNQNRANYEKYENQMQTYPDVPGIKPKPMEPKKILETD
jgi:general secretion pathway protein D